LATPTKWNHGTTAAGHPFRTPVLDRANAAAVATAVDAAAGESRESRTTEDVIRAVDTAVARLSGAGAAGDAARDLLRVELGWDEELSRRTLDGFARTSRAEHLRSLVRSEVGDSALLERFVADPGWTGPGSRSRRAIGPRLMLQVLAGNVPGVSLSATIRALLARSGVLCKLPRSEPCLLPLFARLVTEEDQLLLGRTIAATWWPGGESSATWVEWSGRAGKVVVYGGERAVENVRRSVPAHVEVVTYGPRLGVAVVLPDAEEDEAAALARDVCAYDQQGCVSPRLVFVVGGSGRSFARRLAEALELETGRHPPPAPSEEEAVAIREVRATYEFGGYEEGVTGLQTPGDSLRWTVLVSAAPDIGVENLPRLVVVSEVAGLTALEAALGPLSGRIQSIGYAGRAGIVALSESAARLGVSRVAPFGCMAWPPPDWRHEGKHQLLPLLNWTDLETFE
jgi:hypothetical protein